MRRHAPIVAAIAIAVAACGDDARPTAPCTITCTDACPDQLACTDGVCAVPGSSCAFDFTRVRAGNGFACALDSFRRAWCWGANDHHQIDASDRAHVDRMTLRGAAQWDAIETGGAHVCGLAGGALACWGANDRGQIDLGIDGDQVAPRAIAFPGAPSAWTAVATGFHHTCAIGDGRLWCWGAGDVGELGTGLADDDIAREVLPDVRDWLAVAAGDEHTCAISASRGLLCWGDNSHGELGDGTMFVRYAPTPIALGAPESVALGEESSCGIGGGGALACWGRADLGELGELPDPDAAHLVPATATALVGWTRVAAGERYACGLRASGDVWCWGAASGGGLGGGRWSETRAWEHVLDGATDLAVGWNRVYVGSDVDAGDLDLGCAIVDGAVWCWGDDRLGELGNGGATLALAPAPLAIDRAWSSITAGADHACAIAGGVAYCWGATVRGQIDGAASGDAPPCVTGGSCDVGAPRLIAAAADQIAAGAAHTCLRAGGAITCWGANDVGQTGIAASPFATPHAIAGDWAALWAGKDGACAEDAQGAVTCWGAAVGTHAPAREPALDGATQIAIGDHFGCALDAAHALVCFGDAGGGAFGTGDTGVHAPTPIARTYARLAIGVGSRFACGLRDDGHVECWGRNDRGQAAETDPDTFVLDPVLAPFAVPSLDACTAIAAGGSHACALCAGAIRCWGDARLGQLGAPLTGVPAINPRTIDAPLAAGDAWVELAAGATFTCARSQAGRVSCWGYAPHGALGNGATAANLPAPVPR